MHNKKYAIIGLGLIGGSVAKALHERLDAKDITAVDPSIDAIEQAINDGCIARGFTQLNHHVWDSEIVFICTPVKKTIEYINALKDKVRPGCILTDVGSTKADIIDFVNSLPEPPCFIGGHPMAGSEKTGYSSSFPHLFENAYYILTPAKSTSNQALEQMNQLISGIGGIPVVLDAGEHDRITGSISHVPHVIASALVNLVRRGDSAEGKMQMLAAGGFKDITRIASSSPEMWENIVLSNKKQIIDILEVYIKILNDFQANIKIDNSEWIYDFFAHSKVFRDSLPNSRRGLIPQNFELVVDVVDKPGIIGEIATILGSNNINIKNINVSNSREFEQGCLRITLPDSESLSESFELLAAQGYRCFKGC